MTLYIEHKNCGCRIAGTGESLECRLSIEYCQHHSAFDQLLADNARLRDVARAADTFYRASNSYIYELTIRTGPDGIERGVDRLRVPYDDLPGHEERTRKREALNAAERAYRAALDAARSSGARGGGE